MKSEIQDRAKFDQVRYANCWEDADILIQALDPKGRHCLSIGSAGDNSFSLLAAGAASVTIAELNPAQIACIRLRLAAYRVLEYRDFLVLLGEHPGDREPLYRRCVPELDDETRAYWDQYSEQIQVGFGRVGKFEAYFSKFRDRLLPWVHSVSRIDQLLESRSREEREKFYRDRWDTWRWRLLFRIFFSRFVMGRLGRDPAFFKYVEGSVADRILERTKHALIELDPSENPYLRWILKGRYGSSLPHALREENYDRIRQNLDRLRIEAQPLEAVIEGADIEFDAYNLSDIFEYMSEANTEALLRKIHAASSNGARLAYWNMLAPRSRPSTMSGDLRSLDEQAAELLAGDKAFFYSRFVIEEVIK